VHQQSQIIVVGNSKSIALAIILALFFGPLGMLYSTVPGAAIMFFVKLVVVCLGVFTLGIGFLLLLITQPACVVWAASSAANHNSRICARPVHSARPAQARTWEVPVITLLVSLVSLLVVITIAAILLGLGLSTTQKVRDRATRTQTMNNMKQLLQGCLMCNDVYKRLPPATGWFGHVVPPKVTSPGGIPMTVHIYLLPYMEQDRLYKQILEGTVGEGNAGLASPSNLVVLPLLSPEDSTSINNGAGSTNFAANLRVFSDTGFQTAWDAGIKPAEDGTNPISGKPWYYGTASIQRSIPDGAANTLAFTTMYSVCGTNAPVTLFYNSSGKNTHSPFFGFHAPSVMASPDTHGPTKNEIFQVRPAQKDCNPSYTPQSFGTDAITVSLFDGSVRHVIPFISTRTWGLLQQPNDGLALGTLLSIIRQTGWTVQEFLEKL